MILLSKLLNRKAQRDIFLTYANREHTDGAGAQLYRIFGIYALSRALGFNYIHSPIAQVDHQGIEILEGKPLDPNFAKPFNDLCKIKNDKPLPIDYETITITDPRIGFHKEILKKKGALPLLIRIVHPHHVLDKMPIAWNSCAEISPFRDITNCFSKPVRVAIHVRRGDVHLLDQSRLLPNSYYIGVGQRISEVLSRLNIIHTIEIHTETPQKNLLVYPDAPGVYNVKVPTEMSANVDRIEEFSNIGKNVIFRINEPAIDSFTSIATADIIVTSKSAFSYLAAILSPRAITVCMPFWHASLPNWFTSDIEGNFDMKRFEKACTSRKTQNQKR